MKNLKLLVLLLITVFSFSCTKLEQNQRGALNIESSTVNAAGLLQSAYETLNNPFQDQSRFWAASEHTTDEAIGPTRGPDWDDNGVWRVLHNHTWNADHQFLSDTYRELLQAQFAASSVLDKNPTPQQAAEARFIRALSMFAVLDGWDQVPFRSDLKDLKKLPEIKKGAAAADFIISELNAIINDLPAGSSSNIIKANKNAARVLMMKLYLNKGVYANRATPTFAAGDMQQVITLADQITGYSLSSNFYDNFSPDNSTKSTEIIYALENTNGVRGGNNQSRWYCTLHYNQRPSGWNGFTTLSDFYDKFEATDKRRGDSYTGVTNVSGLRVGLLVGQQFDQNGTALKDRSGAPLSFTRDVKIKETGTNLEVTGIRVIKYPPDYAKEFPAENEYVIFRWADVMLMKAEALLRTGNAAAGLAIVNQIRANRGATALASLTADNLLDERGRELYWEGWRRNDLVRFGKYLNAYQEKPASTSERLLFPIPNEQLAVNPALKQNPGY